MARDIRSGKFPPQTVEDAAEQMGPENMDNIQEALNRYGGKSDEELLQELKGLKENGVVNDTALQDVAQKIAPMLSPEQQQRLMQVMRQLGGG